MEPKQINIASFMKTRTKIGVANLSAVPKVTLSIREAANGLHLVLVEKMPGCEAKKRELDMLVRATIDQKSTAEKQFVANSGIVAICNKRKSKWLNEPVTLPCHAYGKNFEEKYFVCLIEPNTMSVDTVLVAFQKVLNCFLAYFCDFLTLTTI